MSSMDEVILAINFIEANLTKKMDLDMISGAVHYSKYHLHRVFSDTVGLTIHDYIQRRQLTEAAKLLVFSGKPIVQIAFLSGYQSQQAFTNAFTAMYKMPPNFEGSYEMLDRKEKALWEISFASDDDIPSWMELVRLVIDGFPHLNEEEYIRVLRQKISTGQALIMKDRGSAIGIMLFSYENGSIDFMGSHPLYRKRGVPKALLDKVMGELLRGRKVSITTYREGDKADTGYRDEIKELGFAEAELLVEYGYPTQRFVMGQEERLHE